jgi:hypothetical protein
MKRSEIRAVMQYATEMGSAISASNRDVERMAKEMYEVGAARAKMNRLVELLKEAVAFKPTAATANWRERAKAELGIR